MKETITVKSLEQLELYRSRINKVLDYIERNFERSFTLDELATQASFSKFHFNRISWAMIGETPFEFITRTKLERAATMLVTNQKDSITEIAYKCGFSSLALFSRHFKNYFKTSATNWRIEKCGNSDLRLRLNSNISKTESNAGKTDSETSMYFCRDTKTLKWRTNMELNKGLEVKNLPDMTVAYIRYIGPYKGNDKLFESLFGKIGAWVGAQGLFKADTKSIVIYHDDPSVTDEHKLRISVCVTVPSDTKTDGEIGKMQIAGGMYAVAHFELKNDQFEQAWQWVYGTWLPTSGYQPDEKPCFEMYTEEPKNGLMPVDICIPVKPI